MKNKKLTSIIFAFTAVTLMILSSSVALGVSTENFNKKSFISTTSQNNKMQTLSVSALNASDDIVISNMTGNESRPSTIISRSNALVAYEYQDENGTYINFKISTDFGKTWSNEPYILNDVEFNASSPSLCVEPDKKHAYGVFISDENNSGVIYELDIPDMSNTNHWEAIGSDWSENGFYNFLTADIAYYDDAAYPTVPYIAVFIGSTTLANASCQDSPMFFYRHQDGSGYVVAWDPDVNDCSNISIDIDQSSDIVYGVCEIKNGSNSNLFFFNDNPIENGEQWGNTTSISNQTFTSPENLMHPQIYVEGSDIYIVAETESNVIVIYHSNNSGENWSTYDITTDILSPGATPKSPALYVNETHIACIFIESGNLSITYSANNLTNWTAPIQINGQNGTVADGYRFADIASMENIVWTDNRESNLDIYSYLGRSPYIDLEVVVGSVKLISSTPLFSTKNRIEFTIRNNGDIPVRNVLVNVTYQCENATAVTISYPACVGHLNGGRNESFKKNLFRLTFAGFFNALVSFSGLESITITVDPNDETGDKDYSNNAVTLDSSDDLSYATIFPKLFVLENFFKTLKPKED